MFSVRLKDVCLSLPCKSQPILRRLKNQGNKKHHYNLLVIGGGSGGLACAKEATQFKKSVALLDYVNPSPQGSRWGLGGTCVNVGCIPKKLMHQAALLGRAIEDSGYYGWEMHSPRPRHSWSVLTEAVSNHIRSLNWGYRVQLSQKGIDYFNCYGKFVDEHTVEAVDVNGEKQCLTADNIVLATGCRPDYPNEVLGAVQYGITSDDLFSLKSPPGKTLVIGASYVALECAGFLQGLGYPSSVMIRSRPLKGFDEEMSDHVVQHMEQEEGINIMRQCVPLWVGPVGRGTSGGVSRNNGNGNHIGLLVRYKWLNGQAAAEEEGIWDTVVFATGRRPLLTDMRLERVGISVSSLSGRVIVGEDDSTSLPHVYAIGDVAEGRTELTPVAIKAGKMLARRLFGGSEELMNYNTVPTTVFTPLELSYVGLTERQALDIYGEERIEVYHAYYKPLEYYLPKRDSAHCYIKVVCLREKKKEGESEGSPEYCAERVLGIHITGPNTGEVLQGFTVALSSGTLNISDIQSTIGIHPTCAEEVVKLNITKRSGRDPTVTGC